MGFKESDPIMYAQQQIHGKMREWHEVDIFRRLSRMNAMGYRWDLATLTLINDSLMRATLETPWIHARSSHKVRCGFDHQIAFGVFNMIAPKCLRCWKVCMGLPDFASLMKMEEIQDQLPLDIPCKCGIEVRDYTPRHYGAYFYTFSLDEGRERYEQVVKIVKDNMDNGEEIAKGIILKRGCTEYEMVKGPSMYWKLSKNDAKLYDMLDNTIADKRTNAIQGDLIKAYIKQNWILWAHSHGDMSYLPWNSDTPLFPSVVTYHQGDLELIKKDIATALASTEPQRVPLPVTEEPVTYDKGVIGDQDELT